MATTEIIVVQFKKASSFFFSVVFFLYFWQTHFKFTLRYKIKIKLSKKKLVSYKQKNESFEINFSVYTPLSSLMLPPSQKKENTYM